MSDESRKQALNRLLSAPPTYERRKMIIEVAREEGVCVSTVYSWLGKSGFRLLTKSGNPRKRRADAGPSRQDEYKAIMDYQAKNPDAKGAEIKAALGVSYSVSNINRLLRTNNKGLDKKKKPKREKITDGQRKKKQDLT